MKKRNQNSVLIGFVFAIFIFLFSTIFLITSLYPSILEIEENKKILSNKYDNYNKLLAKGFNFEKFKLINKKYLSNNGDKDLEEKLKNPFFIKVYKNLDAISYDNSLYVNTNDKGSIESVDYDHFIGKNNFLSYLENRSKILELEIKSSEFSEKKDKIKKVLPIYSNIRENNELTDLSFINYIESILFKYNLNSKSRIGIKDIYDVKDDILGKPTGIYYILLPLEISGAKSDILDFIEFIKNSGDIIFKDNDFAFSDKLGSDFQLSEIDSIEFQEYIDSSYKKRTLFDNTLRDFLSRTNQNNDIIDIKVNLKFYISTINSNKIYEKINNIIGKLNKVAILNDDNKKEYRLLHYNYDNLIKIINTIRSNKILNKNGYYKQKINNIFLYLNNKAIKKDITSMKKQLKDIKNLDKIYNKALKYKKIFLKLDSEIYNIAKDLGIESDKIDEKTKKIIEKGIYPKGYIFENK